MKLLHISDLHYGFDVGETPIAQRENYMASLEKELASIATSTKIDYIFFTGDFAWCAKKEEFENASNFIKRVLSFFKLTSDRIFLCPGNHDVDRTELEDKEFPTKQEQADKFLKVEKLEKLSRAYTEYISFCKSLGVSDYKIGSQQSYLTGWLTNADFTLICLNSSWYSKSSDAAIRDRMWIGRNFFEVIQADNIFDQSKPVITIVHHPKGSWAEEERTSYGINVNLFDKVCEKSGLVLSGHTHAVSTNPVYEKRACMLGTGALYDTSKYQNSFYIYDLDSTKQLRTRYYINDEKWKADQPDSLDGYNLKSSFSSKSHGWSDIRNALHKSINYQAFDITLSSISYKSLDSIAKKAYVIEQNHNLPVYVKQYKRAVELLEPFTTSDFNTSIYSSILNACIAQIENDCSLVVEGMQGTGKSTFMSFLYLDILNRYRNGSTGVYPILVDIHEYIKRDSFTSKEDFSNDVDVIKKAIESCPGVKWVMFVDGIDRFKTSFEEFESVIYNKFQDNPKNLVLCFGFAEDVQGSRLRSDNNGFFGSFIDDNTHHIRLQSVNMRELRVRNLLTILCEIYGSEPIGDRNTIVEDWIRQYCNGYLDFRTLIMLFQLVTNPSIGEKTSLSDRVLGYHLNLVNGSSADLLGLSRKAVRYLLSGRKIEMNGGTDKNKQELILYRNKLSRDFLFAYYWIQFMGNQVTNRKIAEFNRISRWTVVFPRSVNRFINDLASKVNNGIYVRNMIGMYGKCSVEMKLNLGFLLGRANNTQAISFLRETWTGINDDRKSNGLQEDGFCNFRTISISLISAGESDIESAFFSVLAENPVFADKNLKQHCLYYYGKSDFINISHEDPITIDMLRNAYQSLENDIKFAFTDKGKERNTSQYSLKVDILTYYNLISCCEDAVFERLNHDIIKGISKTIMDEDVIPVYLKDFVRSAEYNYEMRWNRYYKRSKER